MRILLTTLLVVGLADVLSAELPETSGVPLETVDIGTQSKPVTEHTGPSSDRLSNATLNDLWRQSDLIVEVSVGQSWPTDYVPVGRPPSIFTTYDCHVIALFKASDTDLRIGSAIPVRRNGGLRDRGDHFDNYQPSNEFRFAQGDQYILFLRKRQWMGADQDRGVYYEETVGGASTFRIVGASVQTKGVSTVAEDLQGTRPELLREQLQRLGRTR